MFRCQFNNELSLPSERPFRLVVEKRLITYKNSEGETLSEGWEIVRELFVREQNVEKAMKKYGLK